MPVQLCSCSSKTLNLTWHWYLFSNFLRHKRNIDRYFSSIVNVGFLNISHHSYVKLIRPQHEYINVFIAIGLHARLQDS